MNHGWTQMDTDGEVGSGASVCIRVYLWFIIPASERK